MGHWGKSMVKDERRQYKRWNFSSLGSIVTRTFDRDSNKQAFTSHAIDEKVSYNSHLLEGSVLYFHFVFLNANIEEWAVHIV